MKPINENSKFLLGRPENMTEKECDPLPVNSVVVDGHHAYESIWELDEEDLQHIAQSKRIKLTVMTIAHPPVMLQVMRSLEMDKLAMLEAACKELLTAPHQDHFAVRLNDQEMAALDKIKSLVQ